MGRLCRGARLSQPLFHNPKRLYVCLSFHYYRQNVSGRYITTHIHLTHYFPSTKIIKKDI